MIKDGSFLEVAVAGNALYRKASLQDDRVQCTWAGATCVQVIELAADAGRRHGAVQEVAARVHFP